MMHFNFHRPVYDVETGEHEVQYDKELARKAADYIVDVCVFDNHFERGSYCQVNIFENKIPLYSFMLLLKDIVIHEHRIWGICMVFTHVYFLFMFYFDVISLVTS